MAKDIWVRARCSRVLKLRIAAYLKVQAERGSSIDESDVVRDALIEFLDARQPAPVGTPAPDANTGEQVALGIVGKVLQREDEKKKQ